MMIINEYDDNNHDILIFMILNTHILTPNTRKTVLTIISMVNITIMYH
jgi:hypothetical protein